MITDIITIAWKEFKELLFQRGNIKGGWIGLLVFSGVFGIFLPVQFGREWISSPVSLAYWAWLPFILVSGVVADSFAGERERHTLETLLASRLSDRSILFGKVAAAAGYGWGFTLGMVLLSLVTVNVVYGRGGLLMYSPATAAAIVIVGLLVALLAAGLGIQVSLRAATVRQAQQAFSLMFLLVFIPLFLLPALPESIRLKLSLFLMKTDLYTLGILAVAALAVIDAVLIAAAMARFKRSRLILD